MPSLIISKPLSLILSTALVLFAFSSNANRAEGGQAGETQGQETQASATVPPAESGPPAQAERREPIFPWIGEELYYSVRINNSEAIRAGIRAGEIRRHQGRKYVAVNGMARSRGFFNAVYPIDDHANTFFDPKTSFPLRSEKIFDENSRMRRYDVDYRHGSYVAEVERVRDDRETRFQTAIPGDTHDMVTWLYDLRRVGELSIGDEFSYFIYDGWLLSRVDLKVVEREDLLTPMGWFKTWRLEFERNIMDADDARADADEETNDDAQPDPAPPTVDIREAGRHTGSLWLSRDANFLPVRVTIDTMLGPGEAIIIGYTPGQPR